MAEESRTVSNFTAGCMQYAKKKKQARNLNVTKNSNNLLAFFVQKLFGDGHTFGETKQGIQRILNMFSFKSIPYTALC